MGKKLPTTFFYLFSLSFFTSRTCERDLYDGEHVGHDAGVDLAAEEVVEDLREAEDVEEAEEKHGVVGHEGDEEADEHLAQVQLPRGEEDPAGDAVGENPEQADQAQHHAFHGKLDPILGEHFRLRTNFLFR